jgi:hypothetical protein
LSIISFVAFLPSFDFKNFFAAFPNFTAIPPIAAFCLPVAPAILSE